MRYSVFAMSVRPDTGDVTGEPRYEVIDTEENELFSHCLSPWDVEDQYHMYWNRLNESWETNFPRTKDKVLVLSVTPA